MNSSGGVILNFNPLLPLLRIILAGGLFFRPGVCPGRSAEVPSTNSGQTGLAGLPALRLRQTGSNTFELGRVTFDKAQRTVSIPAKVKIRNEVVEYALVSEQGKGYESILTAAADPTDIHIAFLLLGVGSAPIEGEPNQPLRVPDSNAIKVEVSWKSEGNIHRVPLGSLVLLTSGRPDPVAPSMAVQKWLYNGSLLKTNGFAAQREGSIISLICDPVALINNPGPDRDNDDIHFPNTNLLPPEGSPVQVIMSLAQAQNRERR